MMANKHRGEGIRYSLPNMPPPRVAEAVVKSGIGLKKGRTLNGSEINFIVALIMGWIERQL
jgi:hypothetical protein